MNARDKARDFASPRHFMLDVYLTIESIECELKKLKDLMKTYSENIDFVSDDARRGYKDPERESANAS